MIKFDELVKLIILVLLKNTKIWGEDFKRKSSEEQNYSKSTRTELLNLCQSRFEDPNMRAELEGEFEEESASTKRHSIGVTRLIGKLFVWRMITLSIFCEGFMNRVLYVVTAYCFTW
ncbi:hypothetical protein T01_4168 [Trichinella spiralis]|uniref:Uncharacterized protein n=1 Tax=Trichinella spiralis TaxID=6334 RepID=A0A0V1B587_TRISP|nr:hypothetical protein T01_4168 [Trichinella spiralis]